MSFYVFGSGTLFCTPFGANASANPTPLQLGTMQDVSVEIAASQKELYGKLQFPVAIARTAGKLNMKAKFATIYAKVLNDLFFGSNVVAGQAIGVTDESHVGSATITIVAPNSGVFADDLGVIDGVSGLQLTKVATTPAIGQYSQTAAAYTFNAADVTSAKKISYTYTVAGGFSAVIQNKPMGASPVFTATLTNNQFGANFKLKFPSCISSKISLNMKNEDFMVPELDFSAFSDASGNIFYWDLDQ